MLSLFQGGGISRENIAVKQAASTKAHAHGIKRAPLGNIGNKVTKKMAVEKEGTSGPHARVALKTAVPVVMEDEEDYELDHVSMDMDLADASNEQKDDASVSPLEEDQAVGHYPVGMGGPMTMAPVTGVESVVQQPLPAGVVDIDSSDADSPEYAIEYVAEIYEYMRRLELEYRVSPDYLAKGGFTANMRTVLVEWLIQVHQRFQLAQETLYLTINLVDRFMSKAVVSHDKIQLVGVAALFVASKYEDTFPPRLTHMCALTEDAYTKNQVVEMEQVLLLALNFELGSPLALHFLRRGSRVRERVSKLVLDTGGEKAKQARGLSIYAGCLNSFLPSRNHRRHIRTATSTVCPSTCWSWPCPTPR